MSGIGQEEEMRALRAAIRTTFADVPYPGDDRIADDKMSPNDDLQLKDVREKFRGRPWEEIDYEEDMGLYGEERFFLTPEAYAFYFPAYLMAAVEPQNTLLLSGIINDLVLPESDSWRKARFQEIFSHLTAQQREVVKAFLEYAKKYFSPTQPRDEAELALQRYWRST